MNMLTKSLLLTASLALAYPVIAAGLRTPQVDMTKDQYMKYAEQQFDSMDANKDGKITAEERAARRPGRGAGPGAAMPAEITKAEHMKWAEERFDALDTNKDGKLTAQERAAGRPGPGARFGAAASAVETKQQYLDFAAERFDRMDANKDGKISVEERQAMWGGRAGMMRGGRGCDADGYGPGAWGGRGARS